MANPGNLDQNRDAGRNGNVTSGSIGIDGGQGISRARGFAAMNPEEQRRIASEGGRASHQSGRGHEWTSEEARAAGRKGGEARAENRNNASAEQRTSSTEQNK